MPILCSLDWRHGLVTATLSRDPDGSVRVVLGHGPHELVVHLSQDSLDALVLAAILQPRPKGAKPWDLSLLSCF